MNKPFDVTDERFEQDVTSRLTRLGAQTPPE